MPTTYNVLILGASYGSLLGTKLALAGHNVHLVCLPAEVDLINSEGAIVCIPVRGHDGLVEINSRTLPGKLTAGGPATVQPRITRWRSWPCKSRSTAPLACANCSKQWERPASPACRS